MGECLRPMALPVSVTSSMPCGNSCPSHVSHSASCAGLAAARSAILQVIPSCFGKHSDAASCPEVPCIAAGAEDDGKATALEREVEALRAQDEAALTDRGDRAAKERARGAAVRNQKALWESMLEMRILLQRCLQVSAKPGYCSRYISVLSHNSDVTSAVLLLLFLPAASSNRSARKDLV